MADPIQLSARHSVFVTQFAGRLYNDLLPILDKAEADLLKRLAGNPEDENLELLLDDVRQIQQLAWREFNGEVLKVVPEFAEYEADFTGRFLSSVIEDSAPIALPAPEAVMSAVTSEPFTVSQNGGANVLTGFMKDWTEGQVREVTNIVAGAVVTRVDRREIANRINAAMDTGRTAARTMVRTSLNHISSTARDKTYRENSDVVEGFRIVATLDRRTSSTCRPLDGLEFRFGDTPILRPPFHPGCRTTTSPILTSAFSIFDEGATRAAQGGPVDSDTTYYGWLKNEPAAVQDSVIGPERAKLLREGGLTAEQFRALSTDELFQPLTLAEMRERDERLGLGAFEKAGLADPSTN